MATLQELKDRRAKVVARREAMATRVDAGDKSVQYDLGQADKALAELDRQIAQLEGKTPTRRVRFLGTKGWLK